MATPFATASDSTPPAAASACPWNALDDVLDVFLMAVVFCIGWAVSRMVTGQLSTRKRASVKSTGLWTPCVVDDDDGASEVGDDAAAAAPHLGLGACGFGDATAECSEAAAPAAVPDPFVELLAFVNNAEASPAANGANEPCSMQADADDVDDAATLAPLRPLEDCIASGDFPAALALTRWLARHQGLGAALRCLTAVRVADGVPDAATLQAVMIVSSRAGDMALTTELFEELTKPGFVAFAIMVRGFCSSGDAERALRYFRSMRQQGFKPHTALFDVVLSACERRNMMTAAEELFADMLEAGVPMTGATLAAVVRLHGSRGALADALQVFEEFPQKHAVELDAEAYEAMISVCLGAGRTDLAFDAFGTMTAAEIVAPAKTYEALIEFSLRQGALVEAVDLARHALSVAPSSRGASATESSRDRPRAVLQRSTLEAVLTLAGRRRQATLLGMPLLGAVQAAGMGVSEALASDLRRAAECEAGSGTKQAVADERLGRNAKWHQWRRDFGVGAKTLTA